MADELRDLIRSTHPMPVDRALHASFMEVFMAMHDELLVDTVRSGVAILGVRLAGNKSDISLEVGFAGMTEVLDLIRESI